MKIDSLDVFMDSILATYNAEINCIGSGCDSVDGALRAEEMMPIVMRAESIGRVPYLSIILIFLLASALYLIGKHKKAYLFSIRNIFSGKSRSVLYDDNNQSIFSYSLLWGITFMSLTLFIIINRLTTADAIETLRSPTNGLMYTGIVVGFILLKYVCFRFVGWIFDEEKNMHVYMRSYFTIMGSLGVILIPLSIASIYTSGVLHSVIQILGYFILIISLLLVTYKSIQIFFAKLISMFYIFLYLCTLEILPVLLLLKIVDILN